MRAIVLRAPTPKGQILRSIKVRRAYAAIEAACNAVADLWPDPIKPTGPLARRRAGIK